MTKQEVCNQIVEDKLEVVKWERKTGNKIKENSFKEKLQQKQQEIKNKENSKSKLYNYRYDR